MFDVRVISFLITLNMYLMGLLSAKAYGFSDKYINYPFLVIGVVWIVYAIFITMLTSLDDDYDK